MSTYQKQLITEFIFQIIFQMSRMLIYLDPDVICIKDPVKDLRKINELKVSDEIIAASTETLKKVKMT